MSARLIDKTELRRKFGVSDPTIHRWLKAGLLPQPLYVGVRSPRWPEDEIDALIASRIRQRPSSAAGAGDHSQAAEGDRAHRSGR